MVFIEEFLTSRIDDYFPVTDLAFRHYKKVNVKLSDGVVLEWKGMSDVSFNYMKNIIGFSWLGQIGCLVTYNKIEQNLFRLMYKDGVILNLNGYPYDNGVVYDDTGKVNIFSAYKRNLIYFYNTSVEFEKELSKYLLLG